MNAPPLPLASAADVQGLERLRHRAAQNDPAVLAEATVQFEALFVGMMLESARSASLGNGIFDGAGAKQYLELMDAQVALEIARNGGLGFGKILREQLGAGSAEADRARPIAPARSELPARAPVAALHDAAFPHGLPQSLADLGGNAASPDFIPRADGAEAPAMEPRAEEFVARLLPDARRAAERLGVEPRVLLAQAALETGWGAAIPREAEGGSANNLFGIKAGGAWDGPQTARWTIEFRDGIAERKRESFRAYENPAASFADYVDLIANTPRYAAARANAADPEAYARAVAAAGYATDPAYADKWLAVYRGDRLDGALRGLASGGLDVAQVAMEPPAAAPE
jgi:flagellar protein FlgJ